MSDSFKIVFMSHIQRFAVAGVLLLHLILVLPAQAQETDSERLRAQDLKAQQNPPDLRGT